MVGLPINMNLFFAILTLIPVALLFISCGLLLGSLLSSSQMNGAGVVFTNGVLWLGGIFIPLDAVGGTFYTICYALPFVHAVDAVQAVLIGEHSAVFPHLLWVVGYLLIIFVLASMIFKKKMKE